MKPPPFLYLRPDSLEEAATQLAECGEDAKVLAGGQSLVPFLNFRMARPTVLIDLRLLEELTALRRTGEGLFIGAMVRQRAAELSPVVADACPLIVQALHHVGHLQTRNQGTMGGSIAHGDPSAELPAVALALGAEFFVRSIRGERTLPVSGFYQGPFMTALAADEILTSIRIPQRPGSRTVFTEVARRSGDFALGGLATNVLFNEADAVEEVALAAFGMGGEPIRLHDTEAVLLGGGLSDRTIGQAASVASAEVHPFDDMHADAGYRRVLMGVLVKRSLQELRR